MRKLKKKNFFLLKKIKYHKTHQKLFRYKKMWFKDLGKFASDKIKSFV